jgi:hypothetical protein
MKLRYALSYQQLKPHHRKNTTRQRSAQQRAVSSKEQQISAISPATAPSQITTVQQTDADPARAVALIGSSEKVTVAAIDIGTNSFHLVVGVLRPNTAQGHCRGFEVIDQVRIPQRAASCLCAIGFVFLQSLSLSSVQKVKIASFENLPSRDVALPDEGRCSAADGRR